MRITLLVLHIFMYIPHLEKSLNFLAKLSIQINYTTFIYEMQAL